MQTNVSASHPAPEFVRQSAAMPRSNKRLRHLPGDYGLPVLGRLLPLMKDPYQMVWEHYQKYGAVSRFRLSKYTGVLALGPDISQRLLTDPEQEFSAHLGYDNLIQDFFPGGLLFKDFEDHRFQRRILQTSFKTATMQGYVPTISEVFGRGIGEWDFSGSFLFFPAIKRLLLVNGLKVFYGVDEDLEVFERLQADFTQAVMAQMALVHRRIPGLLYDRGVRASMRLRRHTQTLIDRHRDSDNGSMLCYMCQERREDGERFPDEEIINHLNFVLFAAHDTTTSMLSHLFYHLGGNPEWQERLRAEMLSLGGGNGEPPSWEQLQHGMPVTEQLIQEVLRLHPPVTIMMRRLLRDAELGGTQVPAQTRIFHMPCFNHRMPEYWSDPHAFDPDRFSEERAEHKRTPFLYIPFGGGAHKCIGMHFAKMQAKLFLHSFIPGHRFRHAPEYSPELVIVPLPKPKDDLPLTVEKIN